MRDIPETPLTRNLRVLWSCTDGSESWESWYARHSRGGTPNGRALAAVLFDRARLYWPDFYSPADGPAVAAWAEIIEPANPFITPSVIERAVDEVHASGIADPGPGHFLHVAELILIGDHN